MFVRRGAGCDNEAQGVLQQNPVAIYCVTEFQFIRLSLCVGYTYLLNEYRFYGLFSFTVRFEWIIKNHCTFVRSPVLSYRSHGDIQNYNLGFNIHGSVHRNDILLYKSQRDAHATEFILSDNCSKCFGRYYHPF